MNLINDCLQLDYIEVIKKLSQIKADIDVFLPQHLVLQYVISQDKYGQPVLLVKNSVWLLPLKQYEPKIMPVINKHFPKCNILQWKIKPGI